MTVKLYPRVSSNPDCNRHDGGVTNNAAGSASFWRAFLLGTTPGATNVGTSQNTVAGPTNGVELASIAGGTILLEFISPPLSAGFTISGTVTMNVWAGESATAANAGAQVIIERLDSTLAIASTILNSEKGTELPKISSIAAQNWTATPTSTAMNKGDRIRVRLLANDAGGTMASGNTFTIDTDGPTGAADGDTWIQFNETLTFDTSDPSASTLYLTTTTAGINPGSATEDEAWTSRGGGSTNSSTSSAAGPASVQITDTAGGTALEWYSRQLQAFTLGGKMLFKLRGANAGTTAGNTFTVQVAICASDGTSPTVWGSAGAAPSVGILNQDGVLPSSTPDGAFSVYVSGNDTAVSNGQRLRFRIFLQDGSSAVMTSGKTIVVSYNGTSAAAAGDSYVILPQTVSEQTAAKSLIFDTHRVSRNSLLRR